MWVRAEVELMMYSYRHEDYISTDAGCDYSILQPFVSLNCIAKVHDMVGSHQEGLAEICYSSIFHLAGRTFPVWNPSGFGSNPRKSRSNHAFLIDGDFPLVPKFA